MSQAHVGHGHGVHPGGGFDPGGAVNPGGGLGPGAGVEHICAVVLAAGAGTRLQPLTALRPKPLCPVGNVTPLDRALDRLGAVGLTGPGSVAVNAWHLKDQIIEAVGGRAHISVEPEDGPLGTSGAIGHLSDWIAGRAVLVANADAYLAPHGPAGDPRTAADLAPLLSGWDGRTVRILAVPATASHPGEFGDWRFAGVSLLPADVAAALSARPESLVRTAWRPAERAGRLDLIPYDGRYLDIGTPAGYLDANLDAAGRTNAISRTSTAISLATGAQATGSPAAGSQVAGSLLARSLVADDAVIGAEIAHSVVGGKAQVFGPITHCVVWPHALVAPDECLVDSVRAGSPYDGTATTLGR